MARRSGFGKVLLMGIHLLGLNPATCLMIGWMKWLSSSITGFATTHDAKPKTPPLSRSPNFPPTVAPNCFPYPYSREGHMQPVYTLPNIAPAPTSDVGSLARRLIEYAHLSAVRPLLDELEKLERFA